ncbi:NmrA/HSCARG family protein [Solihabitans fulvus]|uniref:NmrA/HSCARG family protein n=1 Tax=Solihabitans fulvus TaxID=1892852 RepID=A0A5B2X6I1_9PSEU|nr:NmrA/HSCARG family protein [Solihabitans fulvus]KAA2258741.1 NmrA/HSCARG family protein [Solihabitans fulvus]
MAVSDKTILVTGATGQQGGAVAARLLADGWRVRALVRDAAAPAAEKLRAAGAQLVTGDLGDRGSLDAASAGAHGVYSMQANPLARPAAVPEDTELVWGRNIADAAHAAGVRHLVYSSSTGVDRPNGLRSVANKLAIEQHIRSLGVPATIFRPVSFMENFHAPFWWQGGNLASGLDPDKRNQLIALADIGAFVGLAFARPEDYLGETIEIGGDELTQLQIAAAIGRATGLPVEYTHIPIETLRATSETLARAYETMNSHEFGADVPALRERHPGLLDFETWLREGGAARIKSFLDGAPGA